MCEQSRLIDLLVSQESIVIICSAVGETLCHFLNPIIFSRIMSYILSIMICVCMILLDNLSQCLIYIDLIYLSRTCDNIVVLICKLC
jgi:hypothetical protein